MQRIVIFTQNTMASTVATRLVILKNHHRIAAIVLASQLRGDSTLTQVKLAVKLIKKSSWNFAFYKIIESTGYNILLLFHKFFRTKKFIAGTATSITDLAKKYNIELIETGDLSNEDFLKTIAELKPGYVFCTVNQILKKNVFEALGNTLLNTHGSYLPEYRGAAQYFWYLLDGHKQIGVTLHYMNAGLDTGDIIFQQRFDFDRSLSAYGVHHLLGVQFGEMFNAFLERYPEGATVPTIKQNDERATFTRMPTREDVKKFTAAGHHFVTFSDFFSRT